MTKLNEILEAINDPEVCMAHCSVLRGQWLMERGLPNIDQTSLDVMRYIEQLEAALEPFKSGEWGAWKAWLVEGAPTRAEGIQAAKTITKYQWGVDEVLAQHEREEAR